MLRGLFDSILDDLKASNSAPPLYFTIFIGANDACLPPSLAHVTIDKYEHCLRQYVDQLLTNPATEGTKIILITPPPIDIISDYDEGEDEDDYHPFKSLAEKLSAEKEYRGYKTYVSKKRYAEKVMEIAKSYEKETNLVTGLDLFTAFLEYGEKHGKGGLGKDAHPDEAKDLLPGCGLTGAKYFGREVFVDGLHFGPEVSESSNTD
jgi:hypothetical protein